jgi:hypothetical protein
MKLFILIAVLSVLSVISMVHAQDNKIIIDEKSGKSLLIGNCNREALKDTNFAWWFDSQYENYDIDKEILNSVKEKINDYNIIVVMGTWCSDSRRVESETTLISVDRNMKGVSDEVNHLLIEYVPTFIIYNENKDEEVGRIIESPINTLEEDLQSIIDGKY